MRERIRIEVEDARTRVTITQPNGETYGWDFFSVGAQHELLKSFGDAVNEAGRRHHFNLYQIGAGVSHNVAQQEQTKLYISDGRFIAATLGNAQSIVYKLSDGTSFEVRDPNLQKELTHAYHNAEAVVVFDRHNAHRGGVRKWRPEGAYSNVASVGV